VARERASALLSKLAKLRVHVDVPVPGLVLTIDGRTLSSAVIDAEIPVDPGEHMIGASAPGKAKRETLVVARAGVVAPVTIPALVDQPDETAPSASEVVPPRTEDSVGEGGGLPWQKKASLVVGGLAVVGVGVGTFFGLQANGQWSDAKKCPAS
jgi:hypothetical protein